MNAHEYYYRAVHADLVHSIEVAIEHSGLSKAELARRMSMTPKHLYRLLSGKRTMSVRTLARLAYELRVYPSIRMFSHELHQESR